MQSFAQAVASWTDFYHVIGDAAAALMGLLFVSLSLNVDVITRKSNTDLRALAGQTFASFICLLMFAVLFLIPEQGPVGLGLPMLCIDLIMLFTTARRFLGTRQGSSREWGRGGFAIHFAIPGLCFVTVLVIAVTVLMGRTEGLYWFVPVVIMLIFDACLNALDLLLRLREPSGESTPSKAVQPQMVRRWHAGSLKLGPNHRR